MDDPFENIEYFSVFFSFSKNRLQKEIGRKVHSKKESDQTYKNVVR